MTNEFPVEAEFPGQRINGHIIMGTAEVAAILQITKRRVQQLAQSRGLGIRVGNSIAFTFDDVANMAHREPGRPSSQ